jgi:hypothetical protein
MWLSHHREVKARSGAPLWLCAGSTGPFTAAYIRVFTASWGARRCVFGPLGGAWHAICRAGRVGCIGVGLGQPSERPYIYLLLVCFH